MTGQIEDLFRYDGVEYTLAGISEGILFDPSDLGLKPISPSTGCYRGYLTVFGVEGDRLVLDDLFVSTFTELVWEPVIGPPINGINPTHPYGNPGFPSIFTERLDMFNNHYRGLKYQISSSGGLLIADEFLGPYSHIGFQSAWKYKRVIELIFREGVLCDKFDRSEKMKEIRQKIVESTKDVNDISSWKFNYLNRAYKL